MTAASTSRFASAAFVLLALSVSGCGVFATATEGRNLAARDDALEKTVEEQKQTIAKLQADLDATRERLDNALRANADNGSDLMSEKARMNALAGKMDENAHALDELRRQLSQSRTEVDARLDEIKRAQAVQPQQPPPVQIPPEKNAHYAAIEAAYGQKDYNLTRTLGREYVNRYPTDERTDDVEYLMGDADLKDGRPSSAIGEFNHVLKATPTSNVLDKTLFDMGESYMLMHDCQSARLAYESCAKRFPKEKLGIDAKSRMSAIDHPQPGMCAPAP